MLDYPSLKDVHDIFMGALCIYREAATEEVPGKWGVANVIMTRVKHPGWWGDDVPSVVTAPLQFSSFNHGDPNSEKFPRKPNERKVFDECLRCFRDVYYGVVGDNVRGADHYYDKSLDNDPPPYSRGCEIQILGNLRFFKVK